MVVDLGDHVRPQIIDEFEERALTLNALIKAYENAMKGNMLEGGLNSRLVARLEASIARHRAELTKLLEE